MGDNVERKTMAKSATVVKTEQLEQSAINGNDASHDAAHALRVRDLAHSLAREEGFSGSRDSMLDVELAALLHDVGVQHSDPVNKIPMFVPTMPTFHPQIGQNFPINPMNVPGAPYFTCPPEYLQFPFMPASPYGFPPHGYPIVASNSSRRTTNGTRSDKECAMPSFESASPFMPPYPYAFPPQGYPTMASNSSRRTNTNETSTNKECTAPSSQRTSPLMPTSPYAFPPQGYPTMASNSSRRTSTQGTSTNKECAAPSSERASPFMPASPYGFHPLGYPTMASNSSRSTCTTGTSTDKECAVPPSERASPFMPASPYGFPYGFYPQGYPTMASNSLKRASSHGMSTDIECAARSSKRVSPLPAQCSPQGLENNNPTDDSDSDDEDNLPKLKKVAYSYRENEHLAQCWIDTSTDLVDDNAQKLDQMWIRISVMYNKNRPANTPMRPWNTLKSHFYTLQKQTRSFCECYNRKVKLWGSGKSVVDIYQLAQQEYKDRHNGQGFKHIEVWKLLNTCPKFSLVDGYVRGTKKAKTSEAGTYTFSSNVDLSANEDVDADHICPIGQKVAQKNVKGKGKSEELKEINERIDKKMVGFEKYSEKKVAAISRIAEVHEYEILMKDTSNMTPDQLIIHRDPSKGKIVENFLVKEGVDENMNYMWRAFILFRRYEATIFVTVSAHIYQFPELRVV